MSHDEEHLLDFSAAMRDFAIMFPTASTERIEEVLRLHDGDVASTIDALLRETQPSIPPPSYEEAIAVPPRSSPVLPSESTNFPAIPPTPPRRSLPPVSAPPNYARSFFTSEPNTSQAAPVRRRESRTSLDSERLRLQQLKRENERRLDQVTDEKEARMLEDEQMALLLQHRELMRASRREPRSSSVTVDSSHSMTRRRNSSKHSAPPVPEGPVVDEIVLNTDDIKDKIKKLSKVSRQRLVQLTSRFRSGSNEHVY